MPRDTFEQRAVKSMLDIAVLSLVAKESKHGYAIITELSEKTGVLIGAGMIYPLLYELEDRGLIEGRWTSPERRTKKMYSITRKGRSHLEDGLHAVGNTLKLIAESANLATIA